MSQLPETLSDDPPSRPSGTKSASSTKRKPKPVLIKWLDAHQVGYWQEGNEDIDADPVEVLTLGWVLKSTAKGFYVAQSMTEDNHANAIVIPKNMVVSVTTLDI
jgi:hypothetical protein